MQFFPKSSSTQSNAKCTMHVFSFPFLNVDVLQKESCYITLISISSESKQASPKSKDTLRFTCLITGNT